MCVVVVLLLVYYLSEGFKAHMESFGSFGQNHYLSSK